MKRKKHTNPNCQCASCKSKRGEYKGKNHPMFGICRKGIDNPNYIDGRTLKKYYCVDCGKQISIDNGLGRGNGRCNSCSKKGKRNSMFGKKWTQKQKIKQSIITKKAMNNIEIKMKIRRPRPKIRGENNPMFGVHRFGKDSPGWQGGKSFEEYGKEFDSALKEAIRQRDSYKCQVCGCSQLENGRCLDVHHKDYNKKNNKFGNLIALCKSCHMKTNYNRNYWKEYFKNKLEIYYERIT